VDDTLTVQLVATADAIERVQVASLNVQPDRSDFRFCTFEQQARMQNGRKDKLGCGVD